MYLRTVLLYSNSRYGKYLSPSSRYCLVRYIENVVIQTYALHTMKVYADLLSNRNRYISPHVGMRFVIHKTWLLNFIYPTKRVFHAIVSYSHAVTAQVFRPTAAWLQPSLVYFILYSKYGKQVSIKLNLHVVLSSEV